MTISSTNRKAGPYLGNGTVVTFPFSFKVFKKEDLAIIYADEHGIEQLMSLESDYTVQLNTEQEITPGGTVTLIHAPTAGARVTITSVLEYMQPVKITNQGGFYPQIINDALDRLTIFVQQLSEQVERSIKVKITSNKDPDELVASLEDNAALAKQSAADAKESAQNAQNAALILTGTVQGVTDMRQQFEAGKHFPFNQVLCDAIGGYPKGSVILGSDGVTLWQNMVDGNRTDTSGWSKLITEDRLKYFNRIPGEIGTFCFVNPPEGWLMADGAAISRAKYAKLFDVIGVSFGKGDGNTTFNLPDLRGQFIRGWSAGRTNLDVGRVLGSIQGDAMRNITGSFTASEAYFGNGGASGAYTAGVTGNNMYEGHSGTAFAAPQYIYNFNASRVVPTAAENRPSNIALAIFIFAGF